MGYESRGKSDLFDPDKDRFERLGRHLVPAFQGTSEGREGDLGKKSFDQVPDAMRDMEYSSIGEARRNILDTRFR